MKKTHKYNKGQVVVEYMLMIAAVAAIVMSLLGMVKKRYLGDMTSCDKPANKKTMLCMLNNVFVPGQGKKFQYFPFKK